MKKSILLLFLVLANITQAGDKTLTTSEFFLIDIIAEFQSDLRNSGKSGVTKKQVYDRFLVMTFAYWSERRGFNNEGIASLIKNTKKKFSDIEGDATVGQILANYRNPNNSLDEKMLGVNYDMLNFPMAKEDFLNAKKYKESVDDFVRDLDEICRDK